MKKLSRQIQFAIVSTVIAMLILCIFTFPFAAIYCVASGLWMSAVACLVAEIASIFALITLIED